jgi:hypothetical protein
MIAWGGITLAEAGVESPLLAIDGLQRFKGSGGSRTVIRFDFAPVVQLWMYSPRIWTIASDKMSTSRKFMMLDITMISQTIKNLIN